MWAQSCPDQQASNMCTTSNKMNEEVEEGGEFKKPRTADIRRKRNYSNNLIDCVKTFCCECDQVINLSGLRKHLLNKHKVNAKDYVKVYGNPKIQIVKMVYHECGLCKKTIVLDYDVLVKHLKLAHKIKGPAVTDYNNSFLKMIVDKSGSKKSKYNKQKQQQPGTSHVKSSTSSSSSQSSSSPTTRVAPVPTCNHCLRLFSSNMQLKMHMRRDHV